MNWKNYFYFQKRDKIAILILLALIVISGIIYFATKPSYTRNSSGVNTMLEEEFINFQSQLTDRDTVTDKDKIYKDEDSKRDHHKYTHQEKLKPGETIELNEADTSELKKVPEIGSTYASRIVKYRNLLGGYVDINQLKEIWGMDDERFSKISPYITIKPDVAKVRINSASFQQLNKHPYISYKQAKTILDVRERKGRIESVNRLSLLEEFSKKDIDRLIPYLDFD